jgi:arsenate reductase (thioredoxin)
MKPALHPSKVLRVLFLCTGNSARSQMAEAVLNRKGRDRFLAASAGSQPVARVNPYAVQALAEGGIADAGHEPRGITHVCDQQWDFVITVCDRAKEACPVLPGQPIFAHWGMPDPAAVEGDDGHKPAAFRDALVLLNRRIDLLLALPFEKVERLALEARLHAIGEPETADAVAPDAGDQP